MFEHRNVIMMKNKVMPFIHAFTAIVALLFVHFIFYSTESILAYIIGIIIVRYIFKYGKIQNDKVRKSVPYTQHRNAFLLGGAIMAGAIILTAIWSGINPIMHAYRVTPLPKMFYIIILAPIGEEVIYRQLLYKDAFAHKWVGRLVSGSLFIAIHTPTTFYSLAFYILATVALFVAYEKSGNNLWVAIALHIANNAFAFM